MVSLGDKKFQNGKIYFIQLDRRESRDKLLSYRNDTIEAHKRVNYRNHIDRINNEIQRDNLNHNSLEHLQHQINQFRHLSFT